MISSFHNKAQKYCLITRGFWALLCRSIRGRHLGIYTGSPFPVHNVGHNAHWSSVIMCQHHLWGSVINFNGSPEEITSAILFNSSLQSHFLLYNVIHCCSASQNARVTAFNVTAPSWWHRLWVATDFRGCLHAWGRDELSHLVNILVQFCVVDRLLAWAWLLCACKQS